MKSYILNKLHRFASDSQGAVAIIVASILTFLLVMAFLSIDNSKNTHTETLFKNSLDQALLSAAAKSSELTAAQMTTETKDFFDLNFAGANVDAKFSKFEVSFDTATSEWVAKAVADVKTMNTAFSASDSTRLEHTAKVKWDETTVEVVFAVDNSASMCAQFDPSGREAGKLIVQPDNNCTKLKHVKDALKYIIGGDTGPDKKWAGLPAIKTKTNQPGYKIGIVPFNHKVKFPDLDKVLKVMTEMDPDPSYFKSFSADPGAAETESFPLPPIMPLIGLKTEADRQAILAKVDNLKTYHDVPGWTRSNVGLFASVLMLDPQYKSSYPGGMTPNNFGTPKNEKIVFLLTDGANMGCCFSSHEKDGAPDYSNQYLYSYREDNNHLIGDPGNDKDGLCGQAKEAGIQIYTVIYDVDDRDAGGAGLKIKNVLRECSSGGDGINFFDLKLEDADGIKRAYQKIAQTLMRLRLTY